MRIVVTGSAGHLGEALMRTLRRSPHEACGVDVRASPYTDFVGSIVDRAFVRECVANADAILHTAALHKPHVVTHDRQQFVDTNVTGTLNLLEESAGTDVRAFIFTSTTSVYGHAARPAPGAPAAWITEDVVPAPRNIYGITKRAAEDLCELVHRRTRLPCVVLRTSRFFPDEDDDARMRAEYSDANVKVNEYLYRRADVEDVVEAHLAALERSAEIGFGRYIVSATTPFRAEDCPMLGVDAPAVLRRACPAYASEYPKRRWRMFPRIDRVYVNERARRDLRWAPRYEYASVLRRLTHADDFRSELAVSVGVKGYHDGRFDNGSYPVE